MTMQTVFSPMGRPGGGPDEEEAFWNWFHKWCLERARLQRLLKKSASSVLKGRSFSHALSLPKDAPLPILYSCHSEAALAAEGSAVPPFFSSLYSRAASGREKSGLQPLRPIQHSHRYVSTETSPSWQFRASCLTPPLTAQNCRSIRANNRPP